MLGSWHPSMELEDQALQGAASAGSRALHYVL